MKLKWIFSVTATIAAIFLIRTWTVQAESQQEAAKVRLVRAVMCESIEAYEPRYIAVAFSIETGRISCFTAFDEVLAETAVDHKWFRRHELVTTKRLTIKPPSWSTYSSIQLREADKGPWRVEVRQADGALLATLRFSVTD